MPHWLKTMTLTLHLHPFDWGLFWAVSRWSVFVTLGPVSVDAFYEPYFYDENRPGYGPAKEWNS